MKILPTFCQPSYEVYSKHNKLNLILHNRIISLKIIDTINDDIDQLNITFDNRRLSNNLFIPTPEMGKEFNLKLGYVSQLKDFGSFYINSWYISTPPSIFHITAASINLTLDFFNQKNKIWKSNEENNKLTVHQVITEIAQNHQLEPIISEIYNEKIIQDYQYIESDLQFLSRIAKSYNAFLKIRNKNLIFKNYEELENDLIHSIPISMEKIITLQITQQERVNYQSVQAYWYNYDKATYCLEVYPNNLLNTDPDNLSSNKVFTIKEIFSIQEKAKIAIKAKFDYLIRKKKIN